MTKIVGAVFRALLVAIMVALPTVLVGHMSRDTVQVVAILAIFASALTYSEYKAVYPGLVEFRDAPPFNRIRFFALFMMVLVVSLIYSTTFYSTPLPMLTAAVSDLIGRAIDFPFSPVSLMMQLLPDDSAAGSERLLRAMTSMAFLISLLTLGGFVLSIKLGSWPASDEELNLWTNLPTFDPTVGGDLVNRLARDARLNVALACVVPFAVPVALRYTSDMFAPIDMAKPQTLIWTIAIWAILPTSLFMRGLALGRISDMIKQQRHMDGE